MIKITETNVVGWEHAIRGMRNPMNSWNKSDSKFSNELFIGDNDLELMKKLAKAGTDHSKYLRMITVYCDVNGPLYWHKEMDTYRMGVEKNSCSTMHRIQAKEFTLDDFSHEHLFSSSINDLKFIIEELNFWRENYLQTKDKDVWWQMIQLLPSSYNQKRTYMISYQALKNIYHARRNHKLDEWHTFCKWIESLPYSELITGDTNE